MGLQIPSIDSRVQPIEVVESVFGREYNESLVHQLIVAYRAHARSGTKQQKTRAEVSGGGAKPWRQKGTGRARAGTTRSPLWRTGGVTFAARSRDYSQKINKKMYRVGMATILSELLRQGRLFVGSDITPPEPKTRQLLASLRSLEIGKGLYVVDEMNTNLNLASRNLCDIIVCSERAINPIDLVGSEKVILTSESIKRIEARLS